MTRDADFVRPILLVAVVQRGGKNKPRSLRKRRGSIIPPVVPDVLASHRQSHWSDLN